MVSTRRPKKKKVEVVAVSEPSALDGDDDDYAADQVAHEPLIEQDAGTSGTRPESPEFNDKEQRKQRAAAVKEARKEAAEARMEVRVAEAAQRAEVRRDEERTNGSGGWQRRRERSRRQRICSSRGCTKGR